jgi:hypothetical protein
MIDIKSGGFKRGEMIIIASGRQTGKSYWTTQAIDRLTRDLMNRPIEELVLSEGRVHGSRYYCVEPIGGNWKEMELWAEATYGDPGSVWPKEDFTWPEDTRWIMNNRKFWFRNERDRTVFLLRWSR